MEEEGSLKPDDIVAVFAEDIHGETIYERLFTAGNMYLVAAAIGPEVTRNLLIPLLTNETDLDGEVKAIIAEQLGTFVKYVGGDKHATSLIPPLKNLANSEEIFVRDKAIMSLSTVCKFIPAAQADQVITNLLVGLFTNSFTTSKQAACLLLPHVYECVTNQSKAKLRRNFLACMRDETPSVRRAALSAIPAFCQILKQTVIISEIVRQGLQERLSDDDESIRVMIPNCLPQIAAKVTQQERGQAIVPLARAMAKDSSWWVRANMAKALPNLIPYFAADLVGSDVGSIILFLLRDMDPEVKTAACCCCRQIIDVLAKVPAYFVDSVLPEIITLSADRSKQVREEVAADLLSFARILPESIAEERIFPIVATLINDKERDVVIAVLRSLAGNFGAINSFAITRAILPKLLEIAKMEDWRVKIEIIRSFCLFLPFVTQEAIPTQIVPLISDWLMDSVYAVREEMARTLPDILRVIEGSESTSFSRENRDAIIAMIMRLNYSQSLTVRQAALLAVWYIGEVIPQDIMAEKVLPAVLLMASDPVINVRILAAKTLQRLKAYVNQTGVSKITLCLKLLANDPDPDVKYFATHSCF